MRRKSQEVLGSGITLKLPRDQPQPEQQYLNAIPTLEYDSPTASYVMVQCGRDFPYSKVAQHSAKWPQGSVWTGFSVPVAPSIYEVVFGRDPYSKK